jgi:hypothetical protein
VQDKGRSRARQPASIIIAKTLGWAGVSPVPGRHEVSPSAGSATPARWPLVLRSCLTDGAAYQFV